MAKDRFKTSISWEDLQSLGNPDNSHVDIHQEEETTEEATANHKDKVRVYLEKKGRRGKSVTLIKGLSLDPDQLSQLCKDLKTTCGVGGKCEGDHIMIQGDQRKKAIEYLQKIGYKDVKNAGA